jgi:hypothetical protein
MKFKKGSKVQWRWIGSVIEGTVMQIYTKPVVREIKGKKIKRNGSEEKPAYLVKSAAGNLALKLETEISKRDPAKKPKMFG